MDYIIWGILVAVIILKGLKELKIKFDPTVKKINMDIEIFLLDIEAGKKHYFTNQLKVDIKKKYENTYKNLKNNYYEKIGNINKLKFINTYENLGKLANVWNQNYINLELKKYDNLFSNIDGKSLDKQQRKAVVVDEENNLILAGAGSGKTLTIAAKVKYLVDTKDINPDEILLISFTKKAAEEMDKRINNKLNINIKAKTFHKLGIDIISEYRGYRPDVSEKLNIIIDNYFKNTIYEDEKSIEDITQFLGCYINLPKEIEEFDNLGEYHNYIRSLNIGTLKEKCKIEADNKISEFKLKSDKNTIRGEKVKSLEEVIIANYLFLNGIEYIYEYKYPYEIGGLYRKSYRPDFYLPEFDIYIEHFGIDKDYRAPWLNSIEEEKYLEGIIWKRNLHREKGTKLIETYSYYNKNGILIKRLDQKLKAAGVKTKPVDYKEIYDVISNSKEDIYFKELRKLISTFINLFKSNGYKEEKFTDLEREANYIKNYFLKQRTLMFLDIVKSIYRIYENILYENKEIDFNDMVNEASYILKNENKELKYKYIIIDEYQDISNSRFNLIKEIKDKTGAKLICVGDDWQSIYRFAGSDIDLFTNFKNHVGYYELLKLENTYRNSQELIDIAGEFVMKNKKQLKKCLKSYKRNTEPIRAIKYSTNMAEGIDKAIEEIVFEFGLDAQITIIGRNNFDIGILSKDKTNGKYSVDIKDNEVKIKSKDRPNLKLNYLTAHKSKGLESDNIILINLENKITGFPNQTSDEPMLNLVLNDKEEYGFAEERRLFYVALTRTKNTTYLIIPERGISIFANEIIKDFNIETEGINNKLNNNKCPKCTSGYLDKRQNNKSKKVFVGCSNYPLCDFTSPYIEIINSNVVCGKCNGYMIKKNGKNGYFMGCSNYPYCNNTEEIKMI